MVNYELIPQHIIDKGIFLKELGIFEYVWIFEDVKRIITILDEKKIPILGGDVYKIYNGKIIRTYDSWYINKSKEYDFRKKSYERTVSYISMYEERNEGDFLYSIIF